MSRGVLRLRRRRSRHRRQGARIALQQKHQRLGFAQRLAVLHHFSPELPSGAPQAINTVLTCEEALKLHLSLGQILGHLKGYNRSTSPGKRAAANLCAYAEMHRIAVVEARLNKSEKVPKKSPRKSTKTAQ